MSNQSAEFQALVAELNTLVGELKQTVGQFVPPPFTPKALLLLLRDNLDKFTPETRLAIVNELQQSLEGASAQDFLDPQTWKGLWFLLNYQLQAQTAPLREMLLERLGQVPGASVMTDLAGSLEGAKPQDFLDPETWKGLWFLVNYQLQAQTAQLRGKLRGADDA